MSSSYRQKSNRQKSDQHLADYRMLQKHVFSALFLVDRKSLQSFLFVDDVSYKKQPFSFLVLI